VQDTGSYFSLFGQIVILILIQIGGLGIMTISTAFALIFGKKLTAKLETVMQNVMGESNRLNLFQLLKYVVGITIIFETIGSIFLYFTFRDMYSSTLKAIYYSIFHSVSAFCNAGFALYSNSLESFANSLNINLVISALIIFGGLGFVVIMDLRRNIFLKGGIKKLSLHSKIVIATTVMLITFGLISFFISEYNNTMKGMSFSNRMMSSFFQSVTCRTAGFNTISQTNLSYSSILLSLILMFIGASPGSTGGGIKTTTFAIMVLAIISILTGKSNVSAFKKKISVHGIKEAISLIGISIGFLMLLLFALFIVTDGSFQEVTFEAVSAFGTVGLSMGFTSSLNFAGKIIIILLMYLGRIGPLTILYALAQRVVKKRVNYLEENISIG
jgi:trk system potassium uptake protein TrkH